MPRKHHPNFIDDGHGPILRELKPGEKMARITIHASGAECDCLVPDCGLHINVPQAIVPVMERELKGDYRDHRKRKHPEYRGKTLFEFVMGDDVPRRSGDGEAAP